MLLLSVTSILTPRYHSIVAKGCTWPPNAPLEPAGCHNSILWYRSMSISSTLSARIILAASFVVSKVPLLWCCLSGTLELAIIFTIEQAVHFYTCIWQGQSEEWQKGGKRGRLCFVKEKEKEHTDTDMTCTLHFIRKYRFCFFVAVEIQSLTFTRYSDD